MAVQTESITRDVAVQYDYDDICQFVEYEHSYAQRESTPKPVTSHPENSSQLQTEIGDHANSSLCTNDSVSEVSNVSVSLPNMSVMSEYQPHDTDTQPETSVSEIEDSLEVPEAPNMVEERKFIVFESCLDDLLHRCPVCGKLVLKDTSLWWVVICLLSLNALQTTSINGLLSQELEEWLLEIYYYLHQYCIPVAPMEGCPI